MKKSFIALLFLGMASNYAFAEENSIAVVDLQKLVSNSAQVKQLKQEHSKKMEELNKILTWMGNDISNLEFSDQITIMAELAKFIEKIKPIYTKYQMKKSFEIDPIAEFFNNLFKNEDKSDEL